MSNYRLEFDSTVGPNDTERLYYLLGVVSADDELEITMNRNEPEYVDTIVDVLERNDFEVLPKGGNGDESMHLIAHRKK